MLVELPFPGIEVSRHIVRDVERQQFLHRRVNSSNFLGGQRGVFRVERPGGDHHFGPFWQVDGFLHFHPPDAGLRRELMTRWHPDVKAGMDVEGAVRQTEGYSFAEVEELKNLLILNFIEGNGWDWAWAMTQFGLNRQELASRSASRHVGFGVTEMARNGF